MLKRPTYDQARDLLLEQIQPTDTEPVLLEHCLGRVLAQDLIAARNVPAFDRSPYDGYAVRSTDTAGVDRDHPVTLEITQNIPAGKTFTGPLGPGQAAKVLTGAPVPPGADGVVKFEVTEFTDTSVTLFAPVKHGENVVYAGEDVKQGTCLAKAGTVIDPGLAGALAAQGLASPRVYRRPRVGLISTGSELVEPGEAVPEGKIVNSSRFALLAGVERAGCEAVYLGLAGDRTETITELIRQGLESCDLVLLTGGVSVGDFDLTPAAMEQAGAEILVRGMAMKPGMACALGFAEGKPVLALSGNPASALVSFYAVVQPCLHRLCGRAQVLPELIDITLSSGFGKKSPSTRLLRGSLRLTGGQITMDVPPDQGNVVLSSAIGCDAMAIVPAGTGTLAAGTVLKGFLL